MTQRACHPLTPHSGIRFNVRSENHSLACQLRHNSSSDSPTPGVPQHGVNRLWRRVVQPVGVTRGLQHTIPWKRRTSRCRKSRVVNELWMMSPKISSADLTSMNSLRSAHSRPSRKSFHEWLTIQWRRWESNPRPLLASRCSSQLSYVPWLSKISARTKERSEDLIVFQRNGVRGDIHLRLILGDVNIGALGHIARSAARHDSRPIKSDVTDIPHRGQMKSITEMYRTQ